MGEEVNHGESNVGSFSDLFGVGASTSGDETLRVGVQGSTPICCSGGSSTERLPLCSGVCGPDSQGLVHLLGVLTLVLLPGQEGMSCGCGGMSCEENGMGEEVNRGESNVGSFSDLFGVGASTSGDDTPLSTKVSTAPRPAASAFSF